MRALAVAALALAACNEDALPNLAGDAATPGADGGALDLARGPIDLAVQNDLAGTCPALFLDGVNARAAAPPGGRYDSGGPLTVEAWVYARALEGASAHEQVLIAHGGGARDPLYYWLAIDAAGRLVFEFLTDANGDVIAETGDAVPVGRWVHVAGEYDATAAMARLFIDGKLVKSDRLFAQLGTAHGVPLTLGGVEPPPGQNYSFHGYLAEVRVSAAARYAGAFTPARRFAPDAATLVLYHLDENGGDTAHDASGNGNAATLINGAGFAQPPACR